MKVIVTRDAYGIEVWKDGTKLVYEKPFNKINTGTPINPNNSTTVNSDKAWLVANKWPFGKKLYSSKQVKKFFPDLIEKLKIGEKVEAQLDILI